MMTNIIRCSSSIVNELGHLSLSMNDIEKIFVRMAIVLISTSREI